MALCASTAWTCWHVPPFDVVEVSVRPDALRDADEVLIAMRLCRWYRLEVGMISVGPNAGFTIFSSIV